MKTDRYVVNKLTTIAIAISMMFVNINFKTNVIAAEGYSVNTFKSFEEIDSLSSDVSYNDYSKVSLDETTFSDINNYVGYGNTIQTVPSKDGGKPYVAFKLDEGFEINSLADNTYVETEFDAAFNIYGGNSNVNIGLTTSQVDSGTVQMKLINGNRLRIMSDTSDIKWLKKDSIHHYKIVMHNVSDGGVKKWAFSSLKIDGGEILAEERLTTASDYKYIMFRFGVNPSYSETDITDCIFVDNISVLSYNLSQGYIDTPDRYHTLTEIRTLISDMKDACDNGEISSEKFIDIRNRVIKEAEVTENRDVTCEDLLNTELRIDNLRKEFEKAVEYSKINIGGISVTDNNGEAVNYIKEGELESVTLLNHSQSDISGIIGAGIYGDNQIIEGAAISQFSMKASEVSKTIPISINLKNNIRDKELKLFVWNSDMQPIMSTVRNDNDKAWTFSLNGTEIKDDNGRLDVEPYCDSSGNMFLCAKNIINLMGMELERNENTYSAYSEDGKSIEFSVGSDTVNINGEQMVLPYTVTAYEDTMPMISSDIIKKAFGCEVDANELNGVVSMQYSSPEKEYAGLKNNTSGKYTSYSSGTYYGAYKLYGCDKSDRVEVWYRDNLYGYNSQFAGKFIDVRGCCWIKSADAVWNEEDSTFSGGFSNLATSRAYGVKYKITSQSGNSTEWYCDKKAFSTSGREAPDYNEFIYNTNNELLLVPTYENISYYMDYTGTLTKCTVTYKETNTEEWHTAYTPVNDTTTYDNVAIKQYRGSIANLKENTEYTVCAETENIYGIKRTKTAQVRTKNSSPTIGKLIKIQDIYNSGQLLLSGINGTENSWIEVDAEGGEIDGGYNFDEAVLLNNCNYIILKNAVIKGGYRYGISVNGNCSNIIIRNCDISGWGREGVYDENGIYKMCDGSEINYDGGVSAIDANNLTIERCFIHDSRVVTNEWNGDSWTNKHPKGSCGIYYKVNSGCVIRNNAITGNEEHRFNDGIEGMGNGSLTGGPARNTDIYGNIIAYGADDGVEADGGQLNTRIYRNRIEQFTCGISCIPNMAGPTYIYENLVTNMGSSYYSQSGRALKVGGGAGGGRAAGTHFIFNNTFDLNGSSLETLVFSAGNSGRFDAITRNNLFICRDDSKKAFKQANREDSISDYGYDSVYKWRVGYDEGYSGQGSLIGSSAKLPEYTDMENGIFSLAGGVEKSGGTFIDNFNEKENPDMGAFGGEGIYMTPKLPKNIYSNRYTVHINGDKSETLTIHLDNKITEDGGRLIKSPCMEWLNTSEKMSTSESGTSITVTLSAEYSISQKTMGMLIYRTSSGYCVPITVIAKQ